MYLDSASIIPMSSYYDQQALHCKKRCALTQLAMMIVRKCGQDHINVMAENILAIFQRDILIFPHITSSSERELKEKTILIKSHTQDIRRKLRKIVDALPPHIFESCRTQSEKESFVAQFSDPKIREIWAETYKKVFFHKTAKRLPSPIQEKNKDSSLQPAKKRSKSNGDDVAAIIVRKAKKKDIAQTIADLTQDCISKILFYDRGKIIARSQSHCSNTLFSFDLNQLKLMVFHDPDFYGDFTANDSTFVLYNLHTNALVGYSQTSWNDEIKKPLFSIDCDNNTRFRTPIGSLSNGSRHCLIGDNKGNLHFLNPETGAYQGKRRLAKCKIRYIESSPKYIAVSGFKGVEIISDDDAPIKRVLRSNSRINYINLWDTTLISNSNEAFLQLTDIETDKTLWTQDFGSELIPDAIHREGSYLLAANKDRVVQIWDLRSKSRVTQFQEEHPIFSLACQETHLICGQDIGFAYMDLRKLEHSVSLFDKTKLLS